MLTNLHKDHSEVVKTVFRIKVFFRTRVTKKVSQRPNVTSAANSIYSRTRIDDRDLLVDSDTNRVVLGTCELLDVVFTLF